MAERQFTTEELEHEIWRPVVGYEAIYSISNLGRLRRDKSAPGTRAGRLVAPRPDIDGYPIVSLSVHNVRRNHKIHKLVMTAFVGPRPSGLEINHKDGDKFNARLENLEYITPLENHHHAMRLGLVATGNRHGSVTKPHRTLRGESVNTARFTPDIVRLIRQRYAAGGITQEAIGKEYGVSKTAIRLIIIRRNWKHV